MKTIAILIAGAFIAAAPTAALAAQKHKREYEKPLQKVDVNDASYRFARDSLPIFMPSWSMPFVMKMREGEATATPEVKHKHRKKLAQR